MTMEGQAHDGDSPPPSNTETAVVITVGSSESECSVGKNMDPKGGGEVFVEQQKQLKGEEDAPRPERGACACVVLDVGCGDGGDWDKEKVCRICHLSPEHGESEGSELILLGCGCKGELGIAHKHCAEAWFRVKGNRCCEICGANAKNITGEEDDNFMEEWHEWRTLGSSSISNRNSSERGGCFRSQPFCNFLMALLVIAFILPWFFHINLF